MEVSETKWIGVVEESLKDLTQNTELYESGLVPLQDIYLEVFQRKPELLYEAKDKNRFHDIIRSMLKILKDRGVVINPQRGYWSSAYTGQNTAPMTLLEMRPKTSIIITLQKEGFHNWIDAPDTVKFLRERHRHIFHFRLEKVVEHDDRDIEIILFKREVEAYLIGKYGQYMPTLAKHAWWLEFEGRSCEMIARELFDYFNCHRVEVTEDNENGAVISY